MHEQSDIPTNQVQDLLYGNGIYLALGNGRGENVLSTDGINWKAVAVLPFSYIPTLICSS